MSPLIQGPANELMAEVSPDGRWIAYDVGRIRPVRNPCARISGCRWRKPLAGFIRRRRAARLVAGWTRTVLPGLQRRSDGSSNRCRAWPSRPVGQSRSSAEPDTPAAGSRGGGRTYDVTADGQRFLMLKQSGAAARAGARRRAELVRRAPAAISHRLAQPQVVAEDIVGHFRAGHVAGMDFELEVDATVDAGHAGLVGQL